MSLVHRLIQVSKKIVETEPLSTEAEDALLAILAGLDQVLVVDEHRAQLNEICADAEELTNEYCRPECKIQSRQHVSERPTITVTRRSMIVTTPNRIETIDA